MSPLARFLRINRRLCRWFNLDNTSEYVAHVEYLRLAALAFSCTDVRRVLDVGAGSRWQFPADYKRRFGLEFHGLDVDGEALAENRLLDAAFVGDACRDPLGTGRYDLVTSYSGVEHFPDVAAFLVNLDGALRPGGRAVLQFPGRYAPFVILNRMLPQHTKERLLKRLAPDKAGEIGYPAHSDKCNHDAFAAAVAGAGLEVEYRLHNFFSSSFFYFFFPLFAVMQTIDLLRFVFLPPNFASYNVYVLRKPGPSEEIMWSWHRDAFVRPEAAAVAGETAPSG